MNAHGKIELETVVNMTSKGQILIPKALRNGLLPGRPVRVGLNDRGETVVMPAVLANAETPEERYARILKAANALCGKYSTGLGTDAIMRELRGDWEP